MNESEAQGRAKILCVDDDAALLTLWAKALGGGEVDVTTCASGEEAIQALLRDSFHVVLCDYRMMGTNGLEVLNKASEVQPDAARILISAQADFDTAAQAVNEVGLFRLVPKPIRIRELRMIVDEAIRFGRLQADNRKLHAEISARNTELERINAELRSTVACRTTHAVCAMLRALGLWSEGYFQQAERSTAVARRIALEVGLSDDDLTAIEHGARIKDIGLLAVPKSLLLSPGPLNEDEQAEIRNHVHVGSMLVHEMDFLGDARRIVAEHHEWWDGAGYPRGLAGEDIYVGARIVAVADAYTALVGGGPFRNAMSHDEALAEIQQWAGAQFDADLVGTLCRVPRVELTILVNPAWADAHAATSFDGIWDPGTEPVVREGSTSLLSFGPLGELAGPTLHSDTPQHEAIPSLHPRANRL